MNKNGYIYPTMELNSDGSELFHNGHKKMGFGRTNDLVRRFKEHASRGSKATVGVIFLDPIDCDEVAIPDTELEYQLHKILKNIGYINIERTSIFEKENENVISSTEVFSGVSKKNINGVISIGEELSVDLLKRIVSNLSNVDLFKEDLILLPHQEKTWAFIKERFTAGVKEILLNHKPRSGKSFICYNYLINEKPQNVLLLTQYPILNGQWKAEFENLRGHNYNIIISRDVNKIVLSKTQPNFIMISLQDAKGEDINNISDSELMEGLKKQKFSEILKINWDLIIFDEIHKGKETFKTDMLLSGLKYDRLIGLTATATKNILRGTFSLENIDRYTLEEENKYKELYPYLYKNPKIVHLLYNINDDVKKDMDFFTKSEYFTFNKFFEIKYDELTKLSTGLVYNNDIIKMFNWFFCKGKYNRKTNATFDVINKCQSILLFVDNNECQSYIKDILEKSVGDIYDIYYTNSDINSSSQLLDKIKGSKKKSAEYDPKNGKKVIIIANRQLTTGVTLKYCDMVVFMNDWKSLDEYIQASYRCQSPNDKKDTCYVVDLNPGRAYTILHEYIESNAIYKKDDINKSIREYLECVNAFENFGDELKKVDLELFKSRVSEFSGIENKFFPKSCNNSDEEAFKEKEKLLNPCFDDLKKGLKGKELVKLDDEGPDSGKNTKVKVKGDEREKQIRKTDEYQLLMEKCLNNRDFLLERTPILTLTTRFEKDNIDTIFDLLDNDEDLRNEFLKNLLIDGIIK